MHHVTQQASSSPGRARRKDFPSCIILENTAGAVKHHEGHQTPKLTWHSVASLMNERISLLLCFTTAPPPSQEQMGKNPVSSTTSVAFVCHPQISPGCSPLPGLPPHSVALPVPQGRDISAVTELTCSVCACSPLCWPLLCSSCCMHAETEGFSDSLKCGVLWMLNAFLWVFSNFLSLLDYYLSNGVRVTTQPV